jgi:thymidylate kinase
MSDGAGGGRFIVLEGPNGGGKTTIAGYLQDHLGATMFHFPPEFLRFREEVRLDERVPPVPRLAYYLAAVLHLGELVRESLSRGHVVCDRYLASPLALIETEGSVDAAEIARLVAPFQPYLRRPDLVILVTVGHAAARERMLGRVDAAGQSSPIRQRSQESPAFFHAWEAALRRQAALLGPVDELDSTSLTIDQACRGALGLASRRLGLPVD